MCLTDENRLTPHQIGSTYSGTGHASAEFTSSSVELPDAGWFWLVGFAGADHAFSLRVPVAMITDKTEATSDTECTWRH